MLIRLIPAITCSSSPSSSRTLLVAVRAMCISTASDTCQEFLATLRRRISPGRVGRSGESIRNTIPDTNRLLSCSLKHWICLGAHRFGQHHLVCRRHRSG